MRSDLKVSVIVPVYNVEAYLKETLDAVLRQTLSEIEVICINDGSPDNSRSILEDYQKKDDRIIVVDQENKGLAITRNVGIDKAQGIYTYFMDSDDLIADNCLEILYECSESNQLDLLLFDGTSFFENKDLEKTYAGYKTYYTRKEKYQGVYNGQDMFALMVNAGDYKVPAWLQFIRTSYLQENNLYFPAGIIHEDNLFSYYALIMAERVMHIPDVLFYRRVRPDSIMTTGVGLRNFIGYYVSTYEMIQFVNNNQLSYEAEHATILRIVDYLKRLKDIYDNNLSEDEKRDYVNDEKIKLFTFDMLMPVYLRASSSVRLETQVKNAKEEINTQRTQINQTKVKIEQQKVKINEQKKELKKQQKYIREIKNSKTFKAGKFVMFIPHTIKIVLRYLKKNGFKETIKKSINKLFNRV